MVADLSQTVEKAGLLDTHYLDSLEAHLGQSITADILADGMTELADKLRRADQLAAEEARAALARMAHEIAGCAGQLGLHALTLTARGLERTLLRNRRDACGGLAAEMCALGSKSIAALRARMAAIA